MSDINNPEYGTYEWWQMDVYCSCNHCYGRRRKKRHVESSHLKINGPMQGFLEDDEEMNIEIPTIIQNNVLTIGSNNSLPNMCGQANVNHSPNNENYIQDDCMENDGSNDDHAHVHEQINIEPNAREILNSINIDSNGEPYGNNILHMERTPLYTGA